MTDRPTDKWTDLFIAYAALQYVAWPESREKKMTTTQKYKVPAKQIEILIISPWASAGMGKGGGHLLPGNVVKCLCSSSYCQILSRPNFQSGSFSSSSSFGLCFDGDA